MPIPQGEVILYQTEDGQTGIDVQLKDETVWLTQAQMQELFGRERSVLTKHINNVFKEGELDKERVCAKFAHTAADGKTYQVAHYNLDVIISVGYRVKSKRGTQFRIWATTVLKQHLVQGYSLHQQRLAEKGTTEIRQVLDLLSNTLESHNLLSDDGRTVLTLVRDYTRTWQLLWQYDEDSLPLPKAGKRTGRVPEIGEVREAIASLRLDLLERGEATEIFGQERGHGLDGILGAVDQSFAGQDLYPSIEEKAAHLLYFVIKDHPFTDGNKRIGSFLFLLFLQSNQHQSLPDDQALVALTLLIASSAPEQKDLLIRLVINMISI
ncbi:MAG: virulence protein RhuM/Fic/DOC family protein [Candidatus Electrothrix aestuarii]|uniref:Virulence protein RhuM/Fic/DOC family protein n=1 Tax=Candidatus Electrothrix aestuarii TaxID=3062594 RepID=A0AAU8M0N4_9BACT|nr:virulence protein RhuM/Fic/DOC family protein [Candidatus Electrothrix aestuarii]